MAVQRNDSWPIFWFNSLFLHTIKGNVGQFYFLWNNSCWNHLNFFSLFYLVTITKRYSGALNLWRKKPSLSTKCECILNVINDLSILSLLENSIRSGNWVCGEGLLPLCTDLRIPSKNRRHWMMLIPTRIVCVAVNLTAKPFSIEFYKQMGFFLVCLKFSGDLNLFSDQESIIRVQWMVQAKFVSLI